MPAPLTLSDRCRTTGEAPINYFIQKAVENPHLISLAAGLVDYESLPATDVQATLDELLSRPAPARAALQYGTTHGYRALRERVLDRLLKADGVTADEVSLCPDDVVLTTGSQQLLYLVGEVLLNPGDVVITEAPSYFVYHSALTSLGVRTLSVPMDDEGLDLHALEELLQRLERQGELERVKLVYTCDYFQNPTGLTLSLPRRRRLVELVQRFSKKQRIFILEDAAYRELRYQGDDLPSLKSYDADNSTVIVAGTFSKPLAPGLKTGYGILPRELVGPFLRFKGNHDFGSCNLIQHLIDRMLESGAYDRHVGLLREVYRDKRDALLQALEREFTGVPGANWTKPAGGLYVWLRMPTHVRTGPGSPLIEDALDEGVLYVPGEFCYVNDSGDTPRNEARLSFGVASPEQLHEAVRRLGRAFRRGEPNPKPAIVKPRPVMHCRG